MDVLHTRAPRVFRRAEFLVLVVLVLCYGSATYERNFVWKDDLTLWSDVIKKSPGKPRAYNEAGMWYYERNLAEYAIPYFMEALRIGRPHTRDYARALNNLGLCMQNKGFLDMAIGEFEQAVKDSPEVGMYHVNLGIAYLQKGLSEQGSREMQIGIRLRRGDSTVISGQPSQPQ